jgi:phytoene dehydrogenase-like protein
MVPSADAPTHGSMTRTAARGWVGARGAGVEAPQNVVLVSIASVLDPSLAPSGKHVVHAYTPGNEPYALWEGLERTSPEYKALKEERSQVLWRAVEKAIPDVRKRVEVQMVGTPLTQARFLRRDRGTYGGYGWVGNGAPRRLAQDADSTRARAGVVVGAGLAAGAATLPSRAIRLAPSAVCAAHGTVFYESLT